MKPKDRETQRIKQISAEIRRHHLEKMKQLKRDDEVYNQLKLIPNNYPVTKEDLEEIYGN